jgi:hypothetical protein
VAVGTITLSGSRRAGRRHLLFLIALLGGILIRLVVTLAYRPALLFYDSASYLDQAEHLHLATGRPLGYPLVLWPFRQLAPDTLMPIPVFQHLLGLALAVAVYAFLVRRGLPEWGATLATLPLLFDPLQLVLEHYVLSDVVFEALLVVGCLLLLWNPSPGLWPVLTAGLAIGSSAIVRGAGSFLLVVFFVAVLCLRLGWLRIVAFLLAGILPVAIYAAAFHATYGQYAVTQSGPRFLYARLAPLVQCHNPQLHLPSYEKPLCPRHPVGERPSSDYFMWGNQQGPMYRLVPPPGMTLEHVLGDFDKRVVRAQPRDFAEATLGGFLRGFAPFRTMQVPGFPAWYWLFQDHYWVLPQRWHPQADPGLAGFMKDYRERLWTPGPVLGALLLLAGVAALGIGRARRCGDRVAIGLLAGTCVATLLTSAAVSGISWRYQLPQLTLLPMAGALAVAALFRGPAPGRTRSAPPLQLLERACYGLVLRVPRLRPAYERGVLAVLLALVAALGVAVVVEVGAVRSGWFRRDTASMLGLATGVLLFLGLLLAHRRAQSDLSEGTPTPAQERPLADRPG